MSLNGHCSSFFSANSMNGLISMCLFKVHNRLFVNDIIQSVQVVVQLVCSCEECYALYIAAFCAFCLIDIKTFFMGRCIIRIVRWIISIVDNERIFGESQMMLYGCSTIVKWAGKIHEALTTILKGV